MMHGQKNIKVFKVFRKPRDSFHNDLCFLILAEFQILNPNKFEHEF
jgi:hypothetical protein